MEQFRTPGASQDVADLKTRLIQDAKDQNISEAEVSAEVATLPITLEDSSRRPTGPRATAKGHANGCKVLRIGFIFWNLWKGYQRYLTSKPTRISRSRT